MKIKAKLLQEFMQKNKMTIEELAKDLEVNLTELESLLNGEKVGEKTARRFINYFGADDAQYFIDWDAIGKTNPLSEKEGR